MSYLKLDRTRIRYSSPKMTRGGIILSQVIDSDIGPINPVLVSSTDELDVYFGRSFSSREYFEELLSGDVTLLLTKPYKPYIYEVPVIDTSGYKIVSTLSGREDTINGEEVYIEYTTPIPIQYFDQLPETGEPETKYYVSGEDEYYIFCSEEEDSFEGWIAVSQIPTKRVPGSLNNRDTLRLIDKGWGESNHLTWCWPKYFDEDQEIEYKEEIDDPSSILESLGSHDVEEEGKSIGFILDFSGIKDRIREREDSDWTYLVVPVPSGNKIQFYQGSPLNPDILRSKEDILIPDTDLQDQIGVIIAKLREYEWTCLQIDKEGLVWELYNKDLLDDIRFYNIPGLSFQGDFRVTHNVLSAVSEDYKRIEFYSKTLGLGDEEIKIEVSKIPGKTEWYRIIASRYEYQEVFEGPLYLEVIEDVYVSLEKIINQASSLVEVKVYNEGKSKENPDDGLPEGSYTMSRAFKESPWSPDDYWRGLSDLYEFGVSEDFLMIPRMEDYLRVGVEENKRWYTEYEDLLEYATTKNCQVLISNYPYLFGCTGGMDPSDLSQALDSRPSDPTPDYMYLIKSGEGVISEAWNPESGWRTLGGSEIGRWYEIKESFSEFYTGNQIFNYTDDKDNRLVYFFQDMTINGWPRPSWYVFLLGVLSGEYSIETDEIIYSSPSEFYTEDEVDLEKWKSNFLSDNGHIYYYRRFFSHPGDWKYNTTVLSRFCMDKVSNTITRDFPAYLAKETTGEIIKGLNGILSGLKSRYPIIYSLDIDRIEENQYTQTLSVYLNLGIRETLDKDIKLSVTLNFNFT